jgi:serine/threonine protein kinase
MSVRVTRQVVGTCRTIYDVGPENGQAFIAMEYLEGATLKHMIEGRPLSTAPLLELGIQISDALGAAHSGIVRRDIYVVEGLK